MDEKPDVMLTEGDGENAVHAMPVGPDKLDAEQNKAAGTPISPQPAAPTFQQRFAAFAGPIINCNIRGLMSVTLGAPFNVVMIAICRVFGEVRSARRLV